MTATIPPSSAPLTLPSQPGPAPARRRTRRSPRFRATERRAGIVVLALLLAASLTVPVLSPYTPHDLVAMPLQAPSPAHLFGTDELGRDLLVRVFAALWVNLAITVITVGLCLVIGIVFGTITGLSPKPLREFLQRFIDAMMAIPYLILVLAIVALVRTVEMPWLPPGVGAMIFALTVTGWANYARITATQVQLVVQRESIAAARLLSFSPARILIRHMLPSVVAPSLSLAGSHAVLVTAAVASLSFLGAGVTPPTPELGAIMHGGTPLLATAPWVSVFPGIAVVCMGLGFSLISDSRSK